MAKQPKRPGPKPKPADERKARLCVSLAPELAADLRRAAYWLRLDISALVSRAVNTELARLEGLHGAAVTYPTPEE